MEIDFSKKGSNWGLPSFVKDAKPKFEIQPKDDGAGEWTDGDGKPVAVEDRRDGQHKLVITKALPRDTVDVLVALWCGRVWQYSDENTKPVDEGLEGGEFALWMLCCGVANGEQFGGSLDWRSRFSLLVRLWRVSVFSIGCCYFDAGPLVLTASGDISKCLKCHLLFPKGVTV